MLKDMGGDLKEDNQPFKKSLVNNYIGNRARELLFDSTSCKLELKKLQQGIMVVNLHLSDSHLSVNSQICQSFKQLLTFKHLKMPYNEIKVDCND